MSLATISRVVVCCFVVIAIHTAVTAQADELATPSPQISFERDDSEIVIKVNDRSIATYVYKDSLIPRPYFAHVTTPEGIQVTRNHPPVPSVDPDDHGTMHPGIWVAFGDLDGVDFWRNRADVVHTRFLQEPTAESNLGWFVEQKHYLRPDGSLVCSEEFRCTIHLREGGYLLTWDSTFSSANQFYFGDQEEMGLGLRVATPISEVRGGELKDSESRQGAGAIWSHSARWCDYSGVIDGKRVGMTIMCHGNNFRESWMHARNYGFVAANPFGRKAMNKGELSKVIIKPGETLRLRYAVWIHSSEVDEESIIESVYREYLRLVKSTKNSHPIRGYLNRSPTVVR